MSSLANLCPLGSVTFEKKEKVKEYFTQSGHSNRCDMLALEQKTVPSNFGFLEKIIKPYQKNGLKNFFPPKNLEQDVSPSYIKNIVVGPICAICPTRV